MLDPTLHYVGRPNFVLARELKVQPAALAFRRDTVNQLIRHMVYLLMALGLAAPAGAASNQCLVASAWHQSTTPAQQQSADAPRPDDEEEEEEDEEPDCD